MTFKIISKIKMQIQFKTVLLAFALCLTTTSLAENKPAFDPFQSTNPHLALGVFQNATEAEIKAAYRRRAMSHHPDRAAALGLSPQQAEEAFKNIKQAYDRLSGKAKNSVFDPIFGADQNQRKEPVLPSTEKEMFALILNEFNLFMTDKKLEARIYNEFWQDRFQEAYLKTLAENPERAAVFDKAWDVWIIGAIKNGMAQKIELNQYTSIPSFSGESATLAALWSLETAQTPERAMEAATIAVLTYFNAQEYDVPKTIEFAHKKIGPSLTRAGLQLKGKDGFSIIDQLFIVSTSKNGSNGKLFLILYSMLIEKYPNLDRIERLKTASAYSKDSVIGLLYSVAHTLKNQPRFKEKMDDFLYSVKDPVVDRSVSEWIQILKSAAASTQESFLEKMKQIYTDASSKEILEDGLSKYKFWGNRNFQMAAKKFVEENILNLQRNLPSEMVVRILNSVADPLFKMPVYSELVRSAKSKQEMLEYLAEGFAISEYELSMKETSLRFMSTERTEYAKSVSELLVAAQKNEEARMGRPLKKLDFYESVLNSGLEIYKSGNSSITPVLRGIPEAIAANPTYEGMLILRSLVSLISRDSHPKVFRSRDSGHYLLKTIEEMTKQMNKTGENPSSSRSLVRVGLRCSEAVGNF